MNGQPRNPLRAPMLVCLAVGLVAALATLAGIIAAPAQWLPAYLVAFEFWLGIALGGLAINMLYHLTGGGWGLATARIFEAQANPGLLLLMAVAFVPIALHLPVLYPWADEAIAAHDTLIAEKSAYLNPRAFLLRTVVYFALWIFWSLVLNTATRTADRGVQQRRARRLAIFSGLGLAMWVLTATLSAVDWSMSIEPHWYSSMYGVLFLTAQAVSGLAFAILIAVWQRRAPAPSNLLNTSRLNDLGNLLLAFVMLWSYVSLMQFLIIWSGNLPEEVPWYLVRSEGGWKVVIVALVLLHFTAPFLLLLRRQNKRRPWSLFAIALLLLAMRVVDLCWLTLPPFTHPHHSPAGDLGVFARIWPLAFTLPALGGWWLAVVLWAVARRMALPLYETTTSEELADDVASVQRT